MLGRLVERSRTGADVRDGGRIGRARSHDRNLVSKRWTMRVGPTRRCTLVLRGARGAVIVLWGRRKPVIVMMKRRAFVRVGVIIYSVIGHMV